MAIQWKAGRLSPSSGIAAHPATITRFRRRDRPKAADARQDTAIKATIMMVFV
jgi:hypothetical protein